jgi:hypothetical protein
LDQIQVFLREAVSLKHVEDCSLVDCIESVLDVKVKHHRYSSSQNTPSPLVYQDAMYFGELPFGAAVPTEAFLDVIY